MPPLKQRAMSSNATKASNKSVEVVKKVLPLDSDKINKESCENWRHEAKGLRRINAYALESSILSDVTFVIGPQAKEVRAHRLILALGSPVFEAMFFGELSDKKDIVTIPDMTPELFQRLLAFIYYEHFSVSNENEAFEAAIAADKYGVHHLKEKCEMILCLAILKPKKVWSFLNSALLLNLKALIEKCLDFIKTNTKASFKASSFIEASSEALEHVLTCESLGVDEIELLNNIVRWAKAKAVCEENVKEVLNPLIRHIRFGALEPHDFIGFLDDSGKYLNDSDSLAILKHLINPSFSLPEWCCEKSCRIVLILSKRNYKAKNGMSESRGIKSYRSQSKSRRRSWQRKSLSESRYRSRSPLNHSEIVEIKYSSDSVESSSDSSSKIHSYFLRD